MRTKFSGILTLLLAFVVQLSFAQEKTISGTVADDTGFPLPGVNIVIKGTNTGTQSDFDGNYTITAEVGQTLVFSYLGFKKSEIPVTNSTSTVDVQMEADAAVLEEVVVTGYATRRQEVLASAVSNIGTEEIEQLVPTTSVDNMLQGKAAGVSVTAANGKPGQAAFVRVRGQGSLTAGAGSPLYIVDGAPIREQDLNAISGTDIESISVLKDAATTSQYGSRGANGVVLITTKSGKRNKDATIRFNSRYGFTSKIEDNFDMMNAQQKLDYERELAELGVSAANGLPGNTATDEERQFLIDNQVNWQDEVLRTGVVSSNNFSISGGEEKVDYFFSVGHDRDTGILDNVPGFERLNSRLTLNLEANDWLNLNAGVTYSRSLSDDTRDRNNAQNPFRAAYDINPYEPVYELDENGNVMLDDNGDPMWNWTHTQLNPIEYLRTNLDETIKNTTIGNVGATVTFSDNWNYKFNFSVNHQNLRRETYGLPGNRLNQLIGDPEFPGFKTDRGVQRLDYTASNTLNYNLTTEDHTLDVTGLYEFNYNEINTYFISTSGFASPDLSTAINAGRVDDANTQRTRLTLLSYGLFANYDYKQRYLFSASLRYDGSSNFGEDNQFGLFYSGSVGWNIAKEDFFDVDVVNDLKLRASYGTTGSRSIGRYAYQGTSAFRSGYPGGLATVAENNTNPSLQWEETAMLDIGLEFNMFNYRLRGVVDYYNKKTDNLLFQRPIGYESGAPNFINSNLGEIENSGIEIELAGDIIRTDDMKWTLGGNITFFDNQINKLPEPEIPGESNDIEPGNAYFMNWREGEQINEFYLVRYAGVDSDNGQPMYYNAEGETVPFSEIDTDTDRVMTGKSTIADLEGGFFTDFTYKGWGLRADFVYRSGNYVYNQVKANLVSDGINVQDNQATDAFNYWKEPGDTNVLPSPTYTAGELGAASDRFLEKGDYIRMRNITLSYRFPQETIDRTPFSSVRLYLQGQNLLTFTNFFGDPEVGISSGETISYANTVAPGELTLYSYPNRKSVSFGIDVSL